MAETRAIFSLKTIRYAISDNDWVDLTDVWNNNVRFSDGSISSVNAGYFAGGIVQPPGAVPYSYTATTDKLNYSSETPTSVPGANLSNFRSALSGVGDLTSGYFGGGIFSPPVVGYSTMDKIGYSTDTRTTVPGAALSSARYYLSSTGNSTAGYFGGGKTVPAIVSTMDKLTYSNDTRTTVAGAALSTVRRYTAATGSSTAGYFGGGSESTFFNLSVSTMDKVTYSTDTRTTLPGAALTFSRSFLEAAGSSTAGYFGGGSETTDGPQLSTFNKLTYATETAALSPSVQLSSARAATSATGNSTAGYFSGGAGFLGNYRSNIDKLIYSVDLCEILVTATLSANKSSMGTSSATETSLPINTPPNPTTTKNTAPTPGTSPNIGFFSGGLNSFSPSGALSSTEKINYTTDTFTMVPSASLSSRSFGMPATGNSIAGYLGGGYDEKAEYRMSKVDRISYSTETRETVFSASLRSGKVYSNSTGNQSNGYFAGGDSDGGLTNLNTSTDRINYSTNNTSIVPSAALIQGRFLGMAISSSTSGYFAGGYVIGLLSSVEKITYSTETTTAVPSAVLNTVRGQAGSAGSSTAGYFGGGGNPSSASSFTKLTYSTETSQGIPAVLVYNGNTAATTSSTFGYFVGGNSNFSQLLNKFNYSTETVTYSPSVAITFNRDNHSACSPKTNPLPATGETLSPVIV